MKLRAQTTIVLLVLAFAAILVTSVWTYHNQAQQAQAEMLEKARVLNDEMDAVWEFMSINQDTIDTDADGSYNFKGLYCAIAGKSIAKILQRDTDYLIRYTNDTPRNIASVSDEYESAAIELFASGEADEVYSLEEYDGELSFRYVSPIYLDTECLECHGSPAGEIDVTGNEKEGLEEGDLVGVTSIVMPAESYMESIRSNVLGQAASFAVVILLAMGVVYFMITVLIMRPLYKVEEAVGQIEQGDFEVDATTPIGGKEIRDLAQKFNAMAQQLDSAYASLESTVEARTEQLASANRLLEQQRQQLAEINAELTAENRYKSDFLATVSHELRTPLTSIIAFTDMWEQSSDGAEGDEQTRRIVREIRENGQILLQMVDNILVTARLEAGRVDMTFETIDMVDLVGLVERSLSSLAEQRSITLTTSIAGDVPLVCADWEKLRRILENLVSNAIKFTRRGGQVDIAVSYEAEGDRVLLSVADNGIGIKREDMGSIFERFNQVDKSSNRRYRGSGLGLSVVRDLAGIMGGSVSVQSAYQKGSTFTVRLPADVQAATQEAPADRGESN